MIFFSTFYTRLPLGPKLLLEKCNFDNPLAIFSIIDDFLFKGLSYSGGIICIAIGSSSKGGGFPFPEYWGWSSSLLSGRLPKNTKETLILHIVSKILHFKKEQVLK